MLIKVNNNLFINTTLLKSITNEGDSDFQLNFSDGSYSLITKDEHDKLLTFLRHHDLQSASTKGDVKEISNAG